MFLKQTLYVSVWVRLGKHVPCSIVKILEQNACAYMTCFPNTCNSTRLRFFIVKYVLRVIILVYLLIIYQFCLHFYDVSNLILYNLDSHFVFKKIKTVFIPPYGYFFVIISGVITLRNEVGSRHAWRFFFRYLHSTNWMFYWYSCNVSKRNWGRGVISIMKHI